RRHGRAEQDSRRLPSRDSVPMGRMRATPHPSRRPAPLREGEKLIISLVEYAEAGIAVLPGRALDREVVSNVEIDRHPGLAVGTGGDAQIDIGLDIGAGLHADIALVVGGDIETGPTGGAAQ